MGSPGKGAYSAGVGACRGAGDGRGLRRMVSSGPGSKARETDADCACDGAAGEVLVVDAWDAVMVAGLASSGPVAVTAAWRRVPGVLACFFVDADVGDPNLMARPAVAGISPVAWGVGPPPVGTGSVLVSAGRWIIEDTPAVRSASGQDRLGREGFSCKALAASDCTR
jgi:hypothetical protein